MRHLLNTLFVTSEDVYLGIEGENVVVYREKNILNRFPLHNIQMIVCTLCRALPCYSPTPRGVGGLKWIMWVRTSSGGRSHSSRSGTD